MPPRATTKGLVDHRKSLAIAVHVAWIVMLEDRCSITLPVLLIAPTGQLVGSCHPGLLLLALCDKPIGMLITSASVRIQPS